MKQSQETTTTTKRTERPTKQQKTESEKQNKNIKKPLSDFAYLQKKSSQSA